MSCGVRYEFSILPEPNAAKLLDNDDELPHEDAPQAESHAILRHDPRRAVREFLKVPPPPRGRTRHD